MRSALAFVATVWIATPSLAAGDPRDIAADQSLAEPKTPALVSEFTAPASENEDPVPLDASALDDLRGGQTIVVGNQTLTAITTGNVLNGDYTAGSISLSDNAFSSFNGFGNLAINTGAQVSLQSGMSVVINVSR